jgi:hypothetical protein
MNEIFLITFRNKLYRESLQKSGFSVREFSPPDDELCSVIEQTASVSAVAVLEVRDETIERCADLLELLVKKEMSVILITGVLTDRIRTLSRHYGIPDILEGHDPVTLRDYIDVINTPSKSMGKVIILDDAPPNRSIMRAIFMRFHYQPLFITTLDALFDTVQKYTAQLVLINLGTEHFDVNDFVRRAYSHSKMKKIPLIVYKDIEELFVTEIISGLNRLTKVILSTDELFSFLITFLFRLELFHKIEHLNTLTSYPADAVSGTLQKAINAGGSDIYSLPNLIDSNVYGELLSLSDSMHAVLKKIEGLRWLVRDGEVSIS